MKTAKQIFWTQWFHFIYYSGFKEIFPWFVLCDDHVGFNIRGKIKQNWGPQKEMFSQMWMIESEEENSAINRFLIDLSWWNEEKLLGYGQFRIFL